MSKSKIFHKGDETYQMFFSIFSISELMEMSASCFVVVIYIFVRLF